jgi:hypothetical protein
VRQAWTVIADAAAGHGVQDRELFTARMLDLLGQLARAWPPCPATAIWPRSTCSTKSAPA